MSAAEDDQISPTIVPDGAGGALVTWQDHRSGTNWDIYAQHVNASSTTFWGGTGLDGLALSEASGDQLANGFRYPTIAYNVTPGGAVVVWQDQRSGPDPEDADVYAEGIFVTGAPTIADVLWGDTFIEVAWVRDPDRFALGTMNWVLYVDGDSVDTGTAGEDLEGMVYWNGLEPCASYEVYLKITQGGLHSIASPTVTGWTCCGPTCEQTRPFRAQRLGPSNLLALEPPRPNPAREATEIHWSIPPESAGEEFQLGVFDVAGRKVATVAEGKGRAGSLTGRFQPRAATAPVQSGVYFVRLQIGGKQFTRSLILER